jgi:osmotically-inducible protein OsmY
VVVLNASLQQIDRLPEYRDDADIQRDVQQALFDDAQLRRTAWPTLRVDARVGVVTLRGHVLRRSERAQAEALASRVRGVVGLRSRLVSDDDLAAAISEALEQHPGTTGNSIQVRATLGVVLLAGTPVSAEVQSAALEATAAVPGVRGIVCRLFGTDAITLPQPVFLPAIGTRVFASDGLLGHLEQVIINPRSRGVTHLIVNRGPRNTPGSRSPSPVDSSPRQRIMVAIAHVDRWIDDADWDAVEAAILLRVSGDQATRFAEYREEDFMLPGSDWQPPFDYRPQEVRFVAVSGSRAEPG